MGCGLGLDGVCRFLEYFLCGPSTFDAFYGDTESAGSKIAGIVKSNNVCAICQDIFSKQKNNMYVAPCFHAFHEDCMQTWMNNASTCPTCRKHCSFEKTQEIWKQFFPTIKDAIDLPEGEIEEVVHSTEGDDCLAGAVLRAELNQVDQITQDYLYALQLQAQERDG